MSLDEDKIVQAITRLEAIQDKPLQDECLQGLAKLIQGASRAHRRKIVKFLQLTSDDVIHLRERMRWFQSPIEFQRGGLE